MIDIHCHLLPGIDDGAGDLAEAIELCQLAVANGITHAVATPHIHPGRWENDRASIMASHETLCEQLERRRIPLVLGMAAEVRISPEVISLLAERRIPFLGRRGDQQVMLLELPHSHVPPGSDKLVEWMLRQDIVPMIAHPERNKDVMRDLSKIEPFVGLGCLLQLTAGSVAGRFGEAAARRAEQILQRGWATVLASDAHNVRHRPPDLRPGMEAAAGIVGVDEARRLVSDAPLEIVAAQFAESV